MPGENSRKLLLLEPNSFIEVLAYLKKRVVNTKCYWLKEESGDEKDCVGLRNLNSYRGGGERIPVNYI